MQREQQTQMLTWLLAMSGGGIPALLSFFHAHCVGRCSPRSRPACCRWAECRRIHLQTRVQSSLMICVLTVWLTGRLGKSCRVSLLYCRLPNSDFIFFNLFIIKSYTIIHCKNKISKINDVRSDLVLLFKGSCECFMLSLAVWLRLLNVDCIYVFIVLWANKWWWWWWYHIRHFVVRIAYRRTETNCAPQR